MLITLIALGDEHRYWTSPNWLDAHGAARGHTRSLREIRRGELKKPHTFTWHKVWTYVHNVHAYARALDTHGAARRQAYTLASRNMQRWVHMHKIHTFTRKNFMNTFTRIYTHSTLVAPPTGPYIHFTKCGLWGYFHISRTRKRLAHTSAWTFTLFTDFCCFVFCFVFFFFCFFFFFFFSLVKCYFVIFLSLVRSLLFFFSLRILTPITIIFAYMLFSLLTLLIYFSLSCVSSSRSQIWMASHKKKLISKRTHFL